jgi:hypothetical protein
MSTATSSKQMKVRAGANSYREINDPALHQDNRSYDKYWWIKQLFWNTLVRHSFVKYILVQFFF